MLDLEAGWTQLEEEGVRRRHRHALLIHRIIIELKKASAYKQHHMQYQPLLLFIKANHSATCDLPL